MKKILRDWALIISMLMGVAGYLAYAKIPVFRPTYGFAQQAVAFLQPALIFCMLFLTFCKVNPRKLRLAKWHLWLLLIQGGLFSAISLALVMMPHSNLRIVLEGAMICLICPTATAAAVITRKLGGNLASVTTYTIFINLLAAVLIPALLPFVHPNPAITSLSASMLILSKVFPLLLMPLFCAMLMRRFATRAVMWLRRYPDLPFYIWLVSLALAIAVTAHSIEHSHVSLGTEAWLVAASLLTCVFQFWAGRKIGALYGDKVTAGQALGQKNTVFAIWLGYTFFTPITSIAGGFYSIWHNVINSYQLYRHGKQKR